MKINSSNSPLIFFAAVLVIIAGFHNVLAQGAGDNAPGSLFYQAGISYRQGEYDSAVRDYEKIIDSGLESGNVYYNLGNSYFKKGELGFAVLNYERAGCFIPNDSDLKSNYELTLHTLNLEPRLFVNRPQKSAYRLFEAMTVDSLAVFMSGIYTVLILLFTLNLFLGGLKRFFRTTVFILVALFILSAFALNGRINYLDKSAVVIDKEADVKFEPLENATTYFKLAEGSRVEVIEKAGNWYKLKRFDGKAGWVNKGALALIAGN
ncbi:MAG: SH3 domain-containing protein [Candidatus Omnitrophica bacterium]|nr:SH3 domain-containing protein [Candidatus Omnitrophota bacterium]